MGSLPVLVAVAVAVLVLVWLAKRFGFSGDVVPPGAAELEQLLDGLPGGFDCRQSVRCQNPSTVVAVDSLGRVAVVASHGAHHVAQLLGRQSSVTQDGEVFTIWHHGRCFRFDAGAEAARWSAILSCATGGDT